MRPACSGLVTARALGAWLLIGACTGSNSGHGPEDARTGPASKEPPVARWNDGSITRDKLEARLADELRLMDIQYRLERYERLHDALDGAVEDALLDAEVKRRGLDGREALFAAEVDAKLTEPTEEELKAEFARFVEQVPDAEYDAAKPILRRELMGMRKDARREAFLSELRKASGLVLDFPFPDLPRVKVPINADDPSLGSADAPVTIVEFGGYQCYYCRRVSDVLHRLVDAYPGKVRLVYKDFPIAGHDAGRQAAVAARCAGEQHHYWEMSSVLLANQGRLERDHLEGYARDLGLDLDAWRTCVEDPGWDAKIDAGLKDGRDAGVSSTPTFFVNGLMLTGAHSYDRFAALVDQELAALPQVPPQP